MPFDNSENKNKSLPDLIRDLTLSGAKLPPIFAQLVGIHGQWVTASQTVGKAVKGVGKIILSSTATVVAALFRSENAMNKLQQSIHKINEGRDQKIAKKFKSQNPDADEGAMVEARKAYRETRGTKADKEQAARTAYENTATKKARDELDKTLSDIKTKSREKATSAANEAHGNTFQFWRSRGASQQQAEQLANAEWKRVFRQTFQVSKHSAPNVRVASEAASKVAQASRTAATVTRGAGFAEAATAGRMGALAAGAGSLAGGAATLGLGLLIQAGVVYGMDWWEQWQKKKDAAMKSAMAQQTHLNKLMQTGVQQESQMRQAAFRAEEEMDRKRFENLRILAESKTKMNEADLAMQERIQNIEKQRFAAQKQGELAKQQAGQLKEKAQQTFDYLKEEGRVQDTAHRRGGALAATWGWISNLTGGSFGGNLIEDERGRLLDDSIGQAVQRHGFLGRSKDRALQSIMATAAQARENAMQAVENDFKEHIARYEEFAATIAATQVASLAPELAAARQKLDDEMKKISDFFQTHEQSIVIDRIAQMSFEEAKTSGKLKQDSVTGEYTIQDREGRTKVIQNASDWTEFQSENRSGDAETYERMRKANEESMKLQEKLVSYQQAQVALVQEQVKKQEELLKNLRDSVAKNYESDITGLFGAGNRKTGAEFQEIMQNRADDMRRDAVLASRRFAGNAQAAEEYKLQSDISSAGTRAQRKLRSDEQKERIEHYKKGQTELFALHQKNIMEEHTLAMQNNTKIFQAYIEAAKQQRDAYFRMLDKQLSMEVSASTTFGRAQTDVVQEQQLNLISQKFDEIKTNFESSFNIQKAASDAEFDEAVRADESQFKEKQLKERNALEDSYIKEKYKLERELAVEEHKFRVELIKEEYAYKRSMDQAEKDRDRNNISEMDRIASTADKAKLDELAGLNFNGKTYAELTREERGELFSSIATQQNARVNEALEYVGKKKEDYTDERGNQLEGDALREAITKDLLSAFDKLAADQKTGALGQRYMQVAEGLGNSIENQVMESDERSERHAQAINEGSGAKIDELGNKFIASTQNISRRATENEIHHTNQKAKLENDQQLETNTRTERINQLRAGREAEWDNFKQQTQKRLELRQKEEEEGFKIGVRQIARHETAATNAFTERLGATSGGQWSSAVLKEQNEQRFNNALDDLEDRHAAERKQALANGASDTDMMKLRARQELEMKDLENQKKVSDTMLQRRIGSETGNTSDAMSMWEQIQQSAFGHIEDPMVSAIGSLREQSKEQMDAMLRAQIDQITPLNEEVALSAQIAMNTAMMVQEARKGKGEGASTLKNTIVAPQGLVENKDAMPSWKQVKEYAQSRIKF